jgi:hypothetical protein
MTRRSTAKATSLHGLVYAELENKHGEARAIRNLPPPRPHECGAEESIPQWLLA